jgi:hypothetical protein
VGPLAARAQNAAPFNPVIHLLYNPESNTQYSIVPGLLAIILTMTLVLMTCMALTRERERGTYENLLAMPATPLEIMVGKIAPYVVVGLVQSTIVLGLAKYVFGVPVIGSLMLLGGALTLFIIANLAVGYTFSTIAQSQLQAMQMTVFFLLPAILLSGFAFPFAGMPGWAQGLGEVLPATHFLRIARGILLKGNDFGNIVGELWPLACSLWSPAQSRCCDLEERSTRRLKLEWQFAAIVSGLCIAANQNIFAPALGLRATHFGGGAPHQLRIVADIFHPSGGAVVRKQAGPEMALFPDPGVDHRFGREIALGPGPKIFALGEEGIFRRMRELAGQGQVMGPLLGGFGERRIPVERLQAKSHALAIVGGENAPIEDLFVDNRLLGGFAIHGQAARGEISGIRHRDRFGQDMQHPDPLLQKLLIADPGGLQARRRRDRSRHASRDHRRIGYAAEKRRGENKRERHMRALQSHGTGGSCGKAGVFRSLGLDRVERRG